MRKIVGQSSLKGLFNQMNIPQFIILEGAKGSGRRLMGEYIGNILGANVFSPPVLNIACIREIIEESRNISKNRVYLLADGDAMTRQAQNALLKLAEEPPLYDYIILTVEDRNTLLPTIISRASLHRMESYTYIQLQEFTDNELKLAVCTTPGQILELPDETADEICKFAKKVIDNIDAISTVNLFNISKYLDVTGKGDGYNVNVFLDMLVYVLCQSPACSIVAATKRMQTVLKYSRLHTNKSINKQMWMDSFLLELKGV